jgi:hypothetical protein
METAEAGVHQDALGGEALGSVAGHGIPVAEVVVLRGDNKMRKRR